jgi:hypothetical protein
LKLSNAPAYWMTKPGLIPHGYVSKLDGSVQPYGVVVPESAFDGANHRLDLFLHGRGETLTELSFVDQRMRSAGEFTPKDALVLHPYGRFCNANHGPGEVDVFEAIADVQKKYRIDNERIVVRGFSMGGASTWHLAVHHADFWAAAAPGAGFSETPQFQRITSRPKDAWPPQFEQTLWHLYDATDWAVNLNQVPTVAYNGEIDGQKQAADAMESALKLEGLPLTRIIGPKTGHSYHPESKPEINAFVDRAITNGRAKFPLSLRFTTWTLRYNRQNWITVDAMGQHWERARVDAQRDVNNSHVTITTQNVTALSIHTESSPHSVTIDGQNPGPGDSFSKDKDGNWRAGGPSNKKNALRKQHGLQGPIDDAFLEPFVFVRPTGTPLTEELGTWARQKQTAAEADWKRTFRGEIITIDDTKLSKAQIASSNLILWGDPSSNAILKKLLGKLPIQWTKSGVVFGGKTYTDAVPVFVFPNPLNPKRYIVVNSGFTWHEYAADSNALHTPKLPDWAILKRDAPTQSSGVLAAGFFNEAWEL